MIKAGIGILAIMMSLFFPSFVFPGFCEANVVTVVGMADASSPSARKEAMRNAFRNAVEKGVGVQVATETIVENFEVIQDKIYTVAEGFVEKWEIIEENTSGPHFLVNIKAWVREGKLNKALFLNGIDVKQVYEWVGNPRIIVALKEHIDNSESPIQIAQPALEKKIKERGISVYAGSQVGVINQKDIDMLMNNPHLAKAIGTRVGAEIVIAGKCISMQSREIKIGDFTQHFYTAYLQIQAYNTATGELLHSSHYKSTDKADLSAVGKFDAAMNAIRNCIENATPDILKNIVTTWYNTQNTPETYLVFIDNIDYNQIQEIKTNLVSFTSTRDVELRRFVNGVAEIEVKYEGIKDQFVTDIIQSKIPFQITGEEQNKFYLSGA